MSILPSRSTVWRHDSRHREHRAVMASKRRKEDPRRKASSRRAGDRNYPVPFTRRARFEPAGMTSEAGPGRPGAPDWLRCPSLSRYRKPSIRTSSPCLPGGGRGHQSGVADPRPLKTGSVAGSRPGGSVAEVWNEAAGLRWLGKVGALPGSDRGCRRRDRARVDPSTGSSPGHGLTRPSLVAGWRSSIRAGADGFDRLAPGPPGTRSGSVRPRCRTNPAGEGFTGLDKPACTLLAARRTGGAPGSSDRDVIEQGRRPGRRSGQAGRNPGPGPRRPLVRQPVLESEGRLADRPAAHGGHRELDLEDARAFRQSRPAFYPAYGRSRPWPGRIPGTDRLHSSSSRCWFMRSLRWWLRPKRCGHRPPVSAEGIEVHGRRYSLTNRISRTLYEKRSVYGCPRWVVDPHDQMEIPLVSVPGACGRP